MKTAFAIGTLALLLLAPATALAHCDTLDGPLLETAHKALDSGQVAPVLAWVQPAGEAEVRTAFAEARAARSGPAAARQASERRFFETLVRIHRQGEGAAYTGLKPAGEGVTEALRVADRGIAAGDGSAVEALLVDRLRDGLRERFAALQAQQPPAKDVEAGRKWVAAYVAYVHHVEALEAALAPKGEAHAHAGGHEGH
ncbi:MAG: DUF6448 family protein [Anaeromyxobacter sp.]